MRSLLSPLRVMVGASEITGPPGSGTSVQRWQAADALDGALHARRHEEEAHVTAGVDGDLKRHAPRRRARGVRGLHWLSAASVHGAGMLLAAPSSSACRCCARPKHPALPNASLASRTRSSHKQIDELQTDKLHMPHAAAAVPACQRARQPLSPWRLRAFRLAASYWLCGSSMPK